MPIERFGENSSASLVGWSATGKLLAATDDTAGVHAVVIDPRNEAAATTWTSAPAAIGVAIEAISRNGR
jgi:hypothetical protein